MRTKAQTDRYLKRALGYKPGQWLPKGKQIDHSGMSGVEGEGIGSVGEAVVSALSIGQIHGLMNPAYGTLKDKGRTGSDKDVQDAREGLRTALFVEIGVSGILGYAFESWLAVGVGLGLSTVLFSIGTYALNSGKAEAGTAPKMLEVS